MWTRSPTPVSSRTTGPTRPTTAWSRPRSSSSTCVPATRSASPDWDDLAADGVEILTPDPASSGGARWNLVSLWGAALRGYAGVTDGDEAGATTLMQDVLGNVIVFDKNARDSIQNFEAGNGDVAITYENEVLTAQEAGLEDEAVYPPSTVLIENPVAIVDKWVDEHCVREVAEAFVDYLHSPEAKEIFTDVGFLRSTDVKEAQKGGGQFPRDRGPLHGRRDRWLGRPEREAVQRQRHRHPGDRRLTETVQHERTYETTMSSAAQVTIERSRTRLSPRSAARLRRFTCAALPRLPRGDGGPARHGGRREGLRRGARRLAHSARECPARRRRSGSR